MSRFYVVRMSLSLLYISPFANIHHPCSLCPLLETGIKRVETKYNTSLDLGANFASLSALSVLRPFFFLFFFFLSFSRFLDFLLFSAEPSGQQVGTGLPNCSGRSTPCP